MIDDLDIARDRFPVGDHVSGIVTRVPQPGRIGLMVDLGRAPTGFVDVLHLPRSTEQWPTVRTVSDFEVLQHRPGQVRLWPLDARFRRDSIRMPMTGLAWRAFKLRHPLNSLAAAKIVAVYPSNREYNVMFDGIHSSLAWTDSPPEVGTVATYRIDRQLDDTRRILLRPVGKVGSL